MRTVPPFRLAAILIAIMVMAHTGVMALEPHGQYANGYGPAHDTVMDLVCDETEGVSSAARLTLDPSALLAPAVEPGAPVPDTGHNTLRGWIVPIATAYALRTFLQVFLN